MHIWASCMLLVNGFSRTHFSRFQCVYLLFSDTNACIPSHAVNPRILGIYVHYVCVGYFVLTQGPCVCRSY